MNQTRKDEIKDQLIIIKTRINVGELDPNEAYPTVVKLLKEYRDLL
jgi:hypothetical protein